MKEKNKEQSKKFITWKAYIRDEESKEVKAEWEMRCWLFFIMKSEETTDKILRWKIKYELSLLNAKNTQVIML